MNSSWAVFDNEATIEYDSYQLLPVLVTDPLEMQTRADYDYRVMQPHRVTDPNENSSAFAFTPLGLMHKTALLGKDDGTEGDLLEDGPPFSPGEGPGMRAGVLLEYDLFAFINSGEPVWVRTTQRVHHIHADYLGSLPTEEQNATIVAVEYSDGFGRQLQTRTQAEDLLFGDAQLGDSGLPADQTAANASAVGTLGADNVVVSGAKRYNNKGKVVEQWEPYFSTGFSHAGLSSPPGAGTASHPGQRVRIYYDALGRPQRTLNPDGTEQRVVYGVPNALNTPGSFKASPWERYTYDANDLAPLTHPSDATVPSAHHFTPKSEVIDALGRTVKTTEHNAHFNQQVTPAVYESVVMQYSYDIKGQLLEVTDPLDRVCFEHKYDTAGNNLWTEHLDSGEKKLVVDAQGKPLYSSDAKGAAVYTAYDALQRPTNIWAKDAAGESVTLRQRLLYGDSAGLSDPHLSNHKGQLYEHYDEAGYVQVRGYDFKGNPLRKLRRVIADEELTGTEKYVVDWDVLTLNHHQVDDRNYITDLLYDGLNRVRKSTLPEDVETERKELVPTYNRAGALQAVTFNGTEYVRHIAYNAKGQRVLLAMGNGMMTRYAYDPLTYRLMRSRSEAYTEADDEYTPDGNVQQDLAYLYDLAGNIIGIRDKAPANTSAEGPGNLLKQFAYDPLNRLLSATGRESTQAPVLPEWDTSIRNHDHTATNTYTRAYQFDKLGNVLQEQHTADGNSSNSFTKTFQYHATQAHNKLLSFTVGGNTYDQSYDANGNLTGDDTSRVYAWGYDDKLRFFSLVPGPSSSKIAHYLYDASGTRIKKVVNKPSGKQEVTVYIDGVYEHTYTKDGGTLDTTRNYNTLHVMDGRSRVASVQVGTDADEPTNYPAVRYNLEDHLGTSCVELDDDGTLINREEYYPFGDTCFGAFGKKRYRYVGKERDGESGLYYYGARYYAAWVGRFVSVDPLAASYAHLNPYNYAGNKPIGDLDVDGMQSRDEVPGPDASSSHAGQIPDQSPGVASFVLPEVEIIGTSPYPEGHTRTNTLTLTSVDSRGIPHSQTLSETQYWHTGGGYPGREYLSGGWKSEQEYMTLVFRPLLNDYHHYVYGETPGAPWEGSGSDIVAFNRYADFVLGRDRLADWIGPTLSEQSAEMGPPAPYAPWRGMGGLTPVYPEAEILMFGRALFQAGAKVAAEPLVEQYSLRATKSGFYPVMTRGSKAPTSLTWLEKGEVWKFGTTKNPLTRYPQSYLDNIGEYGVSYKGEFSGALKEALSLERMKILNFKLQSGGLLPPGNKIIR